MCIDATSRTALDLGFFVTVVHNACATPTFQFQGTVVPGPSVQAAFKVALRDAGAEVLAAADLDLDPDPDFDFDFDFDQIPAH